MHLDILDWNRQQLLRRIAENINQFPYYMAGGTGLSLQLGLRQSYDFDFFTSTAFTPDALFHSLSTIAENNISAINVDGSGTCDVLIDGIQVSFFYHPYRNISPLVSCDEVPGLNIAGTPDIACMKCVAIGNRGSKKDFFDLYGIIQADKVEADRLASWLINKYGSARNYAYIAMGMNYFEDAEREKLPKTFVEYDWNKIKDFFSSYNQRFLYSLERRMDELEL